MNVSVNVEDVCCQCKDCLHYPEHLTADCLSVTVTLFEKGRIKFSCFNFESAILNEVNLAHAEDVVAEEADFEIKAEADLEAERLKRKQ